MSLSSSNRGTILVVEDDPWTRTIEEALLGSEGYQVIAARNGEEGLRLANQHLPSAILLDVALPTMSGLEVLKQLKNSLATRDIPVMLVSAYAQLAGSTSPERADVSLQKPFEYDELLAGLQTLISRPKGNRNEPQTLAA